MNQEPGCTPDAHTHTYTRRAMEEPGSLDVPPGMSVFMLFRSDHKRVTTTKGGSRLHSQHLLSHSRARASLSLPWRFHLRAAKSSLLMQKPSFPPTCLALSAQHASAGNLVGQDTPLKRAQTAAFRTPKSSDFRAVLDQFKNVTKTHLEVEKHRFEVSKASKHPFGCREIPASY